MLSIGSVSSVYLYDNLFLFILLFLNIKVNRRHKSYKKKNNNRFSQYSESESFQKRIFSHILF